MWARRLLSVAIVLGAGLAAAGIVAGGLVATPSAGVAELPAGSAGSAAAISLLNSGSATLTIATITPATCANGVGFDVDGVTLPHALLGGSALAVQTSCTASASFGMRRCGFDVHDNQGKLLTSFLGVCETFGAGALQATPAPVVFGTVALGAGSSQTVTVTNAGSAVEATLSVQADDTTGTFRIDTPVPCNGTSGCDVPFELGAGSSMAITVSCHPTTAATVTNKLYAVTSSGARLAPAIAMQCTGAATTGPAIAVSASAVDAGSVEVISGSATASVAIANLGTTPLDITAIDISDSGDGAAADWTFVQSGACTAISCHLAPGAETDLAVTFDPSQVFTRDATMTITSSDPIHATTTVQLIGVGLGRTLELAAGMPSTIDFGYVQNGMTGTLPIQIVDRGDQPLADAELTVMPAGPFSTAPANPVSVPIGVTGTALMLTCAPTGAGTNAFTTTLAGSAADSLSMPISVTATCHGTDSPLIASPPSLTLGELHVGELEAPRTIMLKNTGASSLTLAGDPTLMTPSGSLALVPPPSQTIPPGMAVIVQLTIDTTNEADLTNAIQVSDGTHDIAIPISGTVTTPMANAPSQIALGTFCVGQPTTFSSIALSSTGTGTVGLPTPPAMAQGGASPFDLLLKAPLAYPAALAPTQTAAIQVAPKRSAVAGSASDDVVWHTDVPTELAPHTTVTAQFLDDGAAVAPAALGFGQVPIILFQPDAQPVTIQNCGATAISIKATIKHPFSIDSNNFPTTLMPAEISTFTVGFHPIRPGTFNDVLTIDATGPGQTGSQTELQVLLSGEGTTGQPGPDAGSVTVRSPSSFYDCSCSTRGVRGGWPIALALALAYGRRRPGRRGRR